MQVYRFTVDKFDRNVFAIKGKGGQGVPYIRNPSTDNRVKTQLFTIGVDEGKDLIYQRLQHEKQGPNYCHFPLNEEAGYDNLYFKGLTCEKKMTHFRKGRRIVSWDFKDKNFRRNEPLDLRNYATAALEIYNPVLKRQEVKQRIKSTGRRRINGGIG